MLNNNLTNQYVTFGGYRDDIHKIMPSCYLGVIASTGWDSFTMSSIEMASCGLPLIASKLQGLREAVDDNVTGYVFPPGDHVNLSKRIMELVDNPDKWSQMSKAARKRILSGFSIDQQILKLVDIISSM